MYEQNNKLENLHYVENSSENKYSEVRGGIFQKPALETRKSNISESSSIESNRNIVIHDSKMIRKGM